ncbi:hypothetical protein H310_00543 [Aphanomyces invadans]|uniref:Uncharacterized protein n=1 Tax=Aphanomyces invadans TaxID=157072 RepID=A0A024UWV7_9STRA|nr:hypothetical protein H310_00543 [Aphanomyces invadans]ETW10173.1 hypothetical protein H310_00543 [Aphanomyces invadans]RHY33650.1 hypothetical protein DYB32_001489 [Aphanomyces invadans]|eukprot:XP_008861584.1 hypothetical protein H310_00543 [Aphanomyces invadans]
MWPSISAVQLCLTGLADLSMVPAIAVIQQNRRHFELFVASMHIVVSLAHNISQSFDVPLFLSVDDWHNMSDVLWIAYFLLLCIHVLGLKDIQHTMILRYVAFSCAWMAKTKDTWTSNKYSAVLVGVAIALVILVRLLFRAALLPINLKLAGYAAGAGAVSMALFASPRVVHIGEVPFFTVVVPTFHLALGAMFYFGWKCVAAVAPAKIWDDSLTVHFI